MTTPGFIAGVMLPTLLPVCAGYAVARWVGMDRSSLHTALKFVFLPALVFVFAAGMVPRRDFVTLVAIGAILAASGVYAMRAVVQRFRASGPEISGVPNVMGFALPFLVLSWESRGGGARTALVIFLSCAVVTALLLQGRSALPRLARTPWLYALGAGLLFGRFVSNKRGLVDGIDPLATASYVLLLFHLGASLHPALRRGALARSVLITLGVRLTVGLATAVVVHALFDLRRPVFEAIVVVSLAPPLTRGQLFLAGSERESSDEGGVAALGTLATVAMMVVLLIIDW